MSSKETLVLGDIHFPWPNRAALRAVRKLILDLQPKRIVQVGDLTDVYGLARFSKDPSKGLSLKTEAAQGSDFVTEMLDSCDDLRILEGNHERRLMKALWDSPEFHSTHPTMRELLGVPERSWTPYLQGLELGKVTYMHDLGYSGKTALARTLSAHGGNIVFGHTHRAGILYDGNNRGERHVAMNVGWLGDQDGIDYMPKSRMTDWQVGVGIVSESHRGNVCMSFAPFVNGSFLLRSAA